MDDLHDFLYGIRIQSIPPHYLTMISFFLYYHIKHSFRGGSLIEKSHVYSKSIIR